MISKYEFSLDGIRIPYWQKGDRPRLLIVSGAHGDEHEIVPIVAYEIERRADILPEFLSIPELSPCAMRLKTRMNDEGLDIERSFREHPSHREVCAIMEFLREKKFDLCISFHEDKEWDGFYMYDLGVDPDAESFRELRDELTRGGIVMHTGIDDREDALLGHTVYEGYVHIPVDASLKAQPFFGSWLIKHAIVPRMIVPEVPTKSSPVHKALIIEKCFDYLGRFFE